MKRYYKITMKHDGTYVNTVGGNDWTPEIATKTVAIALNSIAPIAGFSCVAGDLDAVEVTDP